MSKTAHAKRYEKGMEARKARIIEEAQIALSDGPDALSFRLLAAAANVTIPTIYNLVGNKEALCRELAHAILDEIEQAVEDVSNLHPLDQILTPTNTILRLIQKKPALVRAGYIAFDELYRSTDHKSHYEVRKRRIGLQTQAMHSLVQAGLLRGDISAKTLESLLSQSATQNGRDWAFKVVSGRQLKRNLYVGVYSVLLSDATEPLRKQILERLDAMG